MGLCAYIDVIYEGKEYISGFVSNHLTLFNEENARNFNEEFKSCKGEFTLYWWEVCKFEPRMEFLKWLLVETEKLLEESLNCRHQFGKILIDSFKRFCLYNNPRNIKTC